MQVSEDKSERLKPASSSLYLYRSNKNSESHDAAEICLIDMNGNIFVSFCIYTSVFIY